MDRVCVNASERVALSIVLSLAALMLSSPGAWGATLVAFTPTDGMAPVDIGGDGTNDFQAQNDIALDIDSFVTLSASAMFMRDTSVMPIARVSYRSSANVTSGAVGATGTYFDLNDSVITSSGLVNTAEGYQAGTDNWVGISFQDANVNGGATVYGFVQLNVGNDTLSIIQIIYEDMGNTVLLSDAVNLPVELLDFKVTVLEVPLAGQEGSQAGGGSQSTNTAKSEAPHS